MNVLSCLTGLGRLFGLLKTVDDGDGRWAEVQTEFERGGHDETAVRGGNLIARAKRNVRRLSWVVECIRQRCLHYLLLLLGIIG